MHLVDTTLFYSPTSGGVKRYLLAKHAWLREHTTHEHSLLVPGESDHFERGGISTLRGWEVPGAFNYRLPLDPLRWIRALDALEPDVIEVGDAFHTAWAAWRVARRRGIPLITFYHSNLPHLVGARYGSTSETLVARYVRWLYSRFDLVFAPSEHMRDYLDSIGVRRTALRPLGVDVETFHPSRRVRDLRATLGLPPEARLLVYAGRFSGEKNIDVLEGAFARLGEPYHLLLIGGGEAVQRAPNVHVVPYQRNPVEVAEWLASADALVHAGTHETFGLVVLEAMACGLPVVAVRAGAVPELVPPAAGVLAERCAPAAVAEAVEALYGGQRAVSEMGRAAREHVLAHYGWGHVLGDMLASYARAGIAPQATLPARPLFQFR